MDTIRAFFYKIRAFSLFSNKAERSPLPFPHPEVRAYFCTSAYQSLHTEDQIPPKTITALLLVFREHANTPDIIHHAMLLIQKQTEYLNPGQSPFMTIVIQIVIERLCL